MIAFVSLFVCLFVSLHFASTVFWCETARRFALDCLFVCLFVCSFVCLIVCLFVL